MEDILKKAAELGNMIQATDIYQEFVAQKKQVQGDEDASKLWTSFYELSTSLAAKERQGADIEQWEKDSLQELSQKIADNDLMKHYIQAETKYQNLLLAVQQALHDGSNSEEEA